jgi:hypothetical protein
MGLNHVCGARLKRGKTKIKRQELSEPEALHFSSGVRMAGRGGAGLSEVLGRWLSAGFLSDPEVHAPNS